MGERNKFIEFDLESTPLQIFTNSEIGSGDFMWVRFANSQKAGKIGLQLAFDSKLTYNIGKCENKEIPAEKLGTDRNRIWTIKKVGTKVILYCNGELIVELETEASKNEDCRILWAIDFAGIKFHDGSNDGLRKDTASDYFRRYKAGKSKMEKCLISK